jgi:hypothetical protein
VSGLPLTAVPLEAGNVAALLARIPTAAGVAQILGHEEKSLLIARPANLRRWVATQLGAGPPPKTGVRPPIDLTPITSAVAYFVTTSPFGQRLAFERLMGRYVPLSKRRDLKPPVYIHLDPAARFPRLTVRPSSADREHLYGPFRNRAAATAAITALQEMFPLRPCDFAFEPAADLAVGLGCVFAQVGTCSAPCLVRVSEDDYRALAARAADVLRQPAEARPEPVAAHVPPWVGAVARARAVVAERSAEGLELYPVVEGAVVEERMKVTVAEALEPALEGLDWSRAVDGRDDTPWLLSWLHGKRTGRYVTIAEGEQAQETAARLR